MSATVNLLLLLSALLSALTGVGSAVRQPQVAQQVAQPVHAAAAVIAARRRAVTQRPVQPLVVMATAALAPLAPTFFVAAAHPLYAQRRRE
jgi:hypothetical protein